MPEIYCLGDANFRQVGSTAFVDILNLPVTLHTLKKHKDTTALVSKAVGSLYIPTNDATPF